jgi:predicted nucleic acid-binding protein
VINVFVDTNILLYAHDSDAGQRHLRARDLVDAVWDGAYQAHISVQVLQELLHNLRRGTRDPALSAEIVSDYLHWPIVTSDTRLFAEGMAAMLDFQISVWGAMIVAAANRCGARELWTEDLNAGQRYGDVVAVNPLDR